MIAPEHLVGQEDDFIWINGVTDADLEAALGSPLVEGTNHYGRFVTTRETMDRLRDRIHPPEVYRVIWREEGQGNSTTVLARVERPYSRIVATYFHFRDQFPEFITLFKKYYSPRRSKV